MADKKKIAALLGDGTKEKNVQVAVRVRPLSTQEKVNGEQPCVHHGANARTVKIASADSAKEESFPVDLTFWPEDDNSRLYEAIGRPVLDNAFAGFNSTIFAYGQTGSGKTHTMMNGGPGAELDRGLIPRLAHDLYAEIDQRGGSAQVVIEYVEIYGQQEKLADLLAPRENGAKPKPLKVKQSREPKSFFVDGLSRYRPANAQEMELFIRAGSERRATSSTQMNDTSSRSHAIFIITLTQRLGEGDEAANRVSRIKLVDLAGSENLNKSKATGARQQEAMAINSALSSLKRVLTALVDKSNHIPFRDSALTKLLADSLGGNSRTTMIATVGPAEYNFAETKNTLLWACKARKIKNKPVVNEDNAKARIKALEAEVLQLKNLLESLIKDGAGAGGGSGGSGGSGIDPKEVEDMRMKLAFKTKELLEEMDNRREREETLRTLERETEERVKSLSEQYAESQYHLGNARSAWQQLSRALYVSDQELKEAKRTADQLKCQHQECSQCQLEAREKEVADKLSAIGSIEATTKALAEREQTTAATEARLEQLAAQLAQREKSVALREESVAHKERDVARAMERQLELRRMQQAPQQTSFSRSGSSTSSRPGAKKPGAMLRTSTTTHAAERWRTAPSRYNR